MQPRQITGKGYRPISDIERSAIIGDEHQFAALPGGSPESFKLSSYRVNDKKFQQFYYNPTGQPSNLTTASVKAALQFALATWDDASPREIFADPIIIDKTKTIDYSPIRKNGYNVIGWAIMKTNYLGVSRWWTNGKKENGKYSIIEADLWLNPAYSWSTTGQAGKTDLQSVALHESGHCIGMGDIYSSTYGGSLPPTDARTKDFAQCMNLYNGPQRKLGNGDKAGIKILYT